MLLPLRLGLFDADDVHVSQARQPFELSNIVRQAGASASRLDELDVAGLR